ncbi:aminoglycoside adenylyltransferase domain-containing protein [Rossellomorea aquimaris]|uniref:aminoglycoside adenylyltransferase domain-containing protein n=1 Tax=Rossellomorea aquimaris TaxID=189382 RepID=UPI001CFE42F3|nr:aminoglycoside adenylyltransferase domain-containing protein [Rossellomorea aquimaris]
MNFHGKTCLAEVKEMILRIQTEVNTILNEDPLGFYVHGSLTMGGFNPDKSDMDLLVVTKKAISIEMKRKLAAFFLNCSNSPYPIEISFMNQDQLKVWQHPCPFDFHYSEFWRERYEHDLLMGTYEFINGNSNTDPDLAAHITILHNRGICMAGKPIPEAFPIVPRSDYLSSILGDFQDCLDRIEEDPIYCMLNMIRVFWYLEEGVISSKEEACRWWLSTLPKEFSSTVHKVIDCYTSEKTDHEFEKDELLLFRNYVATNVQKLLS